MHFISSFLDNFLFNSEGKICVYMEKNIYIFQLNLNILPSPFSRGSQNFEKFRTACLNTNYIKYIKQFSTTWFILSL